jgi:hypothetical protein
MDFPKKGKVYKNGGGSICTTPGIVWRISLIRKDNYRVNNHNQSDSLKEILWDTHSLVLAIPECLNRAFSH